MELFRTALLSLTLLSSCCAQENPLPPRPSSASTTTKPPNGVSTTLPADNSPSVVNPNMTAANDSRSTVTPTNVRLQSPPNNITYNITGSPGQDSVASMSNSTSADTSGKNNVTTTRSDILKYTTEPLQVNSSEGEHINSTGNTNPETKTASSHADTNASGGKDDSPYSGIILPVVIALIVISLIVFLLMALYKICLKTTPGFIMGRNEEEVWGQERGYKLVTNLLWA
ncbi:hypothetical protein JRQ81_016855 [Phrynocephalus forsythii]|uniref:Endomucin n=1 Tax=Phrynocephalus forsythii TaxID=171643 RepID=A0A9Q1B1I4_9SAUR|nr:hypothetical protein JRQ81_016855 [Phrynocephalus forsythii]